MTTLEFIVPSKWDGKKLREFLQAEHGVSGTTLKRAKCLENGITQNGEHCRTVDIVHSGAKISIVIAEKDQHTYRPYNLDVPVLFEDESIVAFDKPANLPVHPSLGHQYDTLANVYAARSETSGNVFHPLNRLDRDTSGIVLIAKNAHAAYNTKINEKLYLAILCGVPHQLSGTIDLPIGRVGEDSQKRTVRSDGKRACTKYKVLASNGEYSIAKMQLLTGRTHQIRVHMAYIGCPLLGDILYGTQSNICPRQALHCTELLWTHPMTGENIKTVSMPPKDFLSAARMLSLDYA